MKYLLWLTRENEKRLEVYKTYEQAEAHGEWCKNSTNVHFHFDSYKIEAVKQ